MRRLVASISAERGEITTSAEETDAQDQLELIAVTILGQKATAYGRALPLASTKTLAITPARGLAPSVLTESAR